MPDHVDNLRRIRAIHAEAGADDAETLARLFEDTELRDDGTLMGRIGALLDATEHRWVPGIHTPLDVPGLYEVKGFSDHGFLPEYRDPWPGSREQIGHFLTAFALELFPEKLDVRRFGLRIRDLAGAPKDMPNDEVAQRLAIGHEKAPDPGRYDPLMLVKLRRQFRSATDGDVAAYRRALDALGDDLHIDLTRNETHLSAIDVGSGVGNSPEDLNLSLASSHLAGLVRRDVITRRSEVARWVRDNLKDDGGRMTADG